MGAKAFQLIMGYKELVVLFGVLIILFTLLLSFGYSVGQESAEITPGSQPAVVAPVEPSQQEQTRPQAPEIRLKAVPGSPNTGDIIPQNAEKPNKQAEAKPTVKPVSTQKPATAPTMKRDAVTRPPVESPASPSKPIAQTTAQPSNGSIRLQVAALRNGVAAETLIGELRAKGHVAVLQDAQDGWHRVCVGAFNDAEAARAYQRRLSEEGLSSFLRR